MRFTKLTGCLFALFLLTIPVFGQYFPEKNRWELISGERAGFDPTKLAAAIEFAKANESKAPRDQELGQARTFGREPFGEAVGPFKKRGEMTGVIIKGGYLVTRWGEPARVDMTHSVTKSFLTSVVGIAFDDGLIPNLASPVRHSMAPISVYDPSVKADDPSHFGKSKFLKLFESEHNKAVTWDSLLRQTSDWEGTLWGKPDWADRPSRDADTWLTRKRKTPGEAWEYNDVRVNLLALTALNVLRDPLPVVLRERIMDPIGASTKWRWHGYENSYVLLDGQIVQSVSGGGHWGGGMFIDAYDMARFGLLIENEGMWKDRRILSKEFLTLAETPTKANTRYGFMNFFLNTEKKMYPSAPEGTIAFLGNGTNMIFIDKKNDLVIVVRWIDNGKIDEFLGKIYEALR